MVVKTKARPTQTRVKHTILENYLAAWGGIILSGLRAAAARYGRMGSQAHFVYVDCHAYRGRYDGKLADAKAGRAITTVYGSPVIGVQTLEKLAIQAQQYGITLRTNAILIEQKAADYKILRRTLSELGYTSRLVETTDFSALRDQEIAIVNGDSTQLLEPLLRLIEKPAPTYAFFFLDPYGARGIPLSFVGPIIRQHHVDAIINMPYRDLHKKTGLLTKTDLTEDQQQRIRDYNAMFGHAEWRHLAANSELSAIWGEEDEDDDPDQERPLLQPGQLAAARARESQLIEYYKDTLQQVDPDLAVKSIALHYPAVDQTMFYLYLTTHDPTGALTMNRTLWNANLQEQELRWRFRDSVQSKGFVGTLFELPYPTVVPGQRTAPAVIAKEISQQLGGQSLKLRDIYRAFGDSLYFDNEIKKALAILRKANLAAWEGDLTNNKKITLAAGSDENLTR